MFKRRVALLLSIIITLCIMIGLPAFIVLTFMAGAHNALTPKGQPNMVQQMAAVIGITKPVIVETAFNLDGDIVYGQTDNDGFSVGVYDYMCQDAFYLKNKRLPFHEDVKPKDKNKKLVLVYVAMRNDAVNDSMSTYQGYLHLRGKKDYSHDVIVATQLQSMGYIAPLDYLHSGDMTLILVPFSVDKTEDVDNMKLEYMESAFKPAVYIPLSHNASKS